MCQQLKKKNQKRKSKKWKKEINLIRRINQNNKIKLKPMHKNSNNNKNHQSKNMK